MTKRVLQCEYCNHIISENDMKCPGCGANCSEVIKKYKEEQIALEEEKKKNSEEKARAIQKEVTGTFKKVGITSLIICGVIFVGVVVVIGMISISIFNSAFDEKETEHLDEISGELNQSIDMDNYSISITGYEAYAWYDDFFVDDCNTKDGYQKVAFKFMINNTSDDIISTSNIVYSIFLKADNMAVDNSDLSESSNICELIQGKSNYASLKGEELAVGDSSNGYIGFEVPTDTKKLKFMINSEVLFEIDNPVYSE